MRFSKIVRDSARVGLLLCGPALLAWVAGRPFIFPSLGPSAFSLVIGNARENSGRAVIGGHLIGVAGGLVAYHLAAHGLHLGALPAHLSLAMLRLAASGVLSVLLTTAGMCALRAEHPPACATTLIISLGFLATLSDVLCIMLAVIMMFGVHRMISRLQKGRGQSDA